MVSVRAIRIIQRRGQRLTRLSIIILVLSCHTTFQKNPFSHISLTTPPLSTLLAPYLLLILFTSSPSHSSLLTRVLSNQPAFGYHLSLSINLHYYHLLNTASILDPSLLSLSLSLSLSLPFSSLHKASYNNAGPPPARPRMHHKITVLGDGGVGKTALTVQVGVLGGDLLFGWGGRKGGREGGREDVMEKRKGRTGGRTQRGYMEGRSQRNGFEVKSANPDSPSVRSIDRRRNKSMWFKKAWWNEPTLGQQQQQSHREHRESIII